MSKNPCFQEMKAEAFLQIVSDIRKTVWSEDCFLDLFEVIFSFSASINGKVGRTDRKQRPRKAGKYSFFVDIFFIPKR